LKGGKLKALSTEGTVKSQIGTAKPIFLLAMSAAEAMEQDKSAVANKFFSIHC